VARGHRVMASDQRRAPGDGCCFFVAHVRSSSKPCLFHGLQKCVTILRPHWRIQPRNPISACTLCLGLRMPLRTRARFWRELLLPARQ
jgi:hypothetical protein